MSVPTRPDRLRNEAADTASFGRRAPFTLAPDWVALSSVSNNAKVLFWHIAMHVNNARGDHAAWPGRPVLARRMGYSRADKVDRYIRELIDLGAIECFEREREDGGQASNHYVVHETPPPGYPGPASLLDAYAQEKTGGGPPNGDGGGPPNGDGGGPSCGGPNKKNNNHTKNNKPVARSARTAEVVDARARATAPQAASGKNEDQTQPSTERGPARPPERREGTEGTEGDPTAGGSRSRRPESASPPLKGGSKAAREILAALPAEFREGAPQWVRARMAERIDRLILAEQYPAPHVLAAAREVAKAGGTIDRHGHLDAVREVWKALRTGAYPDPSEGASNPGEVLDVIEICPTCGEEPVSGGALCPACARALDQEAAAR